MLLALVCLPLKFHAPLTALPYVVWIDLRALKNVRLPVWLLHRADLVGWMSCVVNVFFSAKEKAGRLPLRADDDGLKSYKASVLYFSAFEHLVFYADNVTQFT